MAPNYKKKEDVSNEKDFEGCYVDGYVSSGTAEHVCLRQGENRHYASEEINL